MLHDTYLNAAEEARAVLWRASEERHAENERAELVRAWGRYHRPLELNFRSLAEDHARRAAELEASDRGVGVGGS